MRKVNEIQNRKLTADELPRVRIADADFPAPFRSGLEYSSPARGTWNIVHTGMLIPEAHEIFVCAAGCLRGVVLTAAEMGAQDRFSTVAVRENNLLDGDMEDLVIEGVTDILNKLPKRPPAVLVYTSCVHHFTGTDLDLIYRTLRERFPDIDFTDCYMNPIMRKSGLTPDQLMRSRLYMLLREREKDPKAVAIIGNDLPTDEDSDLMKVLRGAGLKVHEITSCRTYAEYQEMAESSVYISYYPDAAPGGGMLAERLGGTHYALKFSFDYDEIDETFDGLAEVLGIEARSKDEIASIRKQCEEEIKKTKELIGDMPVSIDYTYCPRPFGLARLLLNHGFRVEKVYADCIPGGDRAAFEALKKEHPDLLIYPTVHAGMRFANTANAARGSDPLTGRAAGSSQKSLPRCHARCGMSAARGSNETAAGSDPLAERAAGSSQTKEEILALGQKAAYFDDTDRFVNVVEGGGMIGYEAVTRTMELMRDAYANRKEMKELVQVKGLGCEICNR